ncbi:MAG: hypothetical protein WA008_04550 [Saprospiraceae bacterium]|nr:hypothetical protein [Candidatus Parvibacillus calidus]
MSRLRCVEPEDEENTRTELPEKLSTFEELEVNGEAESFQKAFDVITGKRPDSAFMDIKLIGGSIFLLLEKLISHGIPIPNIFIATGFSKNLLTTVNAFHNYIVRNLIKPYMDDWEVKLSKAIDALQTTRIRQLITTEGNKLPESV